MYQKYEITFAQKKKNPWFIHFSPDTGAIWQSINSDNFLNVQINYSQSAFMLIQINCVQYKSKEMPQLIGLFSPNLVITNFMQCFLYGPIG